MAWPAVSCSVALGVLGGCNAGSSDGLSVPTAQTVQGPHLAREQGWWIHPDRKQSTLFVSDSDGDQIRIYSTKDLKHEVQIGSITQGIDNPNNVAVDKRGTLYVANNGDSTVTEYPFGQRRLALRFRSKFRILTASPWIQEARCTLRAARLARRTFLNFRRVQRPRPRRLEDSIFRSDSRSINKRICMLQIMELATTESSGKYRPGPRRP